ncbi:hypothetical protein SPBR_05095 [Sporothrix brasiliensis 5110]|uniref:non-specific serine/threonine protein kinase n=1 Tax=Sporothrix brasiliensis 5110 TaxID=1398154 RepID=A0A0C2F8C4_9PEZI|nr:uncharacterized protein SPBR_05095 [Sporothrix brasiliensis 5110]KIH87293.1 hypothetical protein SPBR_05095 [Sporothrix brasiliensis 5110]
MASSSSAGISWDLYPKSGRIQPHEPLEGYTSGGFHPVTLGDALCNGRYVIRHKLGFGQQSTVWLAWDNEHANNSNARPWVAVKIKKATASADSLFHDGEVGVLGILERHYRGTNQQGPRTFLLLLDAFRHAGPNGIHNCIVTEVLGHTLEDLFSSYPADGDLLPPDLVLRYSQQLLQGLDMVHRLGIAHGDICPANIALTCDQAQKNPDTFLATVGANPRTVAYESDAPRPASLPKQLIACAVWDAWYVDRETDVRILDWGSAFHMAENVTRPAQPARLRPPETFFEHHVNFTHDLWMAGSVIYSMVFQAAPIASVTAPDHAIVYELVAKFGPLPAA